MTDSHDGFRDLSCIGDMFKSSIAHMKVRVFQYRYVLYVVAAWLRMATYEDVYIYSYGQHDAHTCKYTELH